MAEASTLLPHENSSVLPDQRSETPATVKHDQREDQMRNRELKDLADVSEQNLKLVQLKNMASAYGAGSADPPETPQANRNALPDSLRSGIEHLSGYAMNDVQVHYNSDKPAQLKAHAYAQGNQIHLGPGQERHLPHEAWHVVQQKQGRVQPTRQFKGITAINDDAGLEREADVMGERANSWGSNMSSRALLQKPINKEVLQGRFIITDGVHQGTYDSPAKINQDIKSAVNYFMNKHDFNPMLEEDVVARLVEMTEEGDVSYITVDSLVKNIYWDDIVDEENEVKETNNLPAHQPLGYVGMGLANWADLRRWRSISFDAFELIGEIKRDLKEKNQYHQKFDQEAYDAEKLFRKAYNWLEDNEITPGNYIDAGMALFQLMRAKNIIYTKFGDFTGSGFSAKGRAHAIDTKDAATAGYTSSAGQPFLQNFKVNGAAKAIGTVYKKDTDLAAAVASETAKAGKHTAPVDVAEALEDKNLSIEAIKTIESGITDALDYNQTDIGYRDIKGADRGKGQIANMGKTNANAYAALAFKAEDKNVADATRTRWEWLHLRGRALGGATDGSNLVVGTRDANTHMIPFESNIRLLAGMVRNGTSKYEDMTVNFKATKPVAPINHKVNEISIDWKLTADEESDLDDYTGSIKFDPNYTASNIAKTEIDKLEAVLKTEREGLKKPED